MVSNDFNNVILIQISYTFEIKSIKIAVIVALCRTRGPTKTNKRFLLNTLQGTVQANKRLKTMELKQSKPKE